MAILLQSSMFAFTPHINKGTIEEISIEKACSELGITEAELKEFNKDFFGRLFGIKLTVQKITRELKYG